jgi:hypothetical protein
MSEFVSVGNYLDRFGAELDRETLKANGIDSFVQADDAGSVDPFLLSGSGGAWLVVRPEDADKAKALLAEEVLGDDFVEPEAS